MTKRSPTSEVRDREITLESRDSRNRFSDEKLFSGSWEEAWDSMDSIFETMESMCKVNDDEKFIKIPVMLSGVHWYTTPAIFRDASTMLTQEQPLKCTKRLKKCQSSYKAAIHTNNRRAKQQPGYVWSWGMPIVCLRTHVPPETSQCEVPWWQIPEWYAHDRYGHDDHTSFFSRLNTARSQAANEPNLE